MTTFSKVRISRTFLHNGKKYTKISVTSAVNRSTNKVRDFAANSKVR